MPSRPAMLLAHSYFLKYDEKQWRKMKPYPPLATLYCVAHLRDLGFAPAFFDAMLADGVEEFFATVDRVEPTVVALVEDNFNFLTKMCTTRMREAALEMIAYAHRRGCRVVVNGSDATDRPDPYLAAGADAVVVGEPERTLADLVTLWADRPNARPVDIPGLVLPGDPEPITTPARPYLKDLDAEPFPAWDVLDVERYREAWNRAHGFMSWNVVTSRGCPYKCNWCAKPVFGTRYAQRSPGDVAEEFAALRDGIGPDHVWFADDIFGLTAHWIETFAEEVTARGARTPFMMQSRANLMTPPVVRALAEAGAEEVWIGAESGSQRILDAMDKGTTVQQLLDATKHLRDAGIRSCWFIQLGYLGETWEDILLTRDLIRRARPDDIGVSVSYPLPGTEFYDAVQSQLGAQTNWRDSNDLAMMFRGEFTSDFYRKIRNLLHDEVDAGPHPTADQQRTFDAAWEAVASARHQHRNAPAPAG